MVSTASRNLPSILSGQSGLYYQDLATVPVTTVNGQWIDALGRRWNGSAWTAGIKLSKASVDDTAVPGAVVGSLSVYGVTGGGASWTFSLLDTAGARFAIVGENLVAGATDLDHFATPTTSIVVQAVSAGTVVTETIEIAINLPLPALPLATGARLAAIGDSQIGYNNTFGGAVLATAAAAQSTAYGFIELASAHDQRFRFDNWYDTADPRGLNYVGANQGIHGDHLEWTTSPQVFGGGILGRLPAVIARRPEILIIEGGINTISTGDDLNAGTPAYCIAKLEKALRLARGKGVWAILMAIYPRADWIASGNTKLAVVEEINAWIRAQVGRDGVLNILDAESLLRPGGVVDTTMYKDGVHLSPKGSLAVGREKLLPILQAAITAGSSFNKDRTVDNLLTLAQANLVGTTGTLTNWTNASSVPPQSGTGQAATGVTITRGRNCSLVASKEVVAGAQEQQVLAITPGGSENGAYFEFTIGGMFTVAEAHTPSQWYQFFVEVEVSSGDALTFLSLSGGHRTSANVTVTQAHALLRESSGDFALTVGGGARTFWLQSEPFRLPDGAAVTDKLLASFTATGNKAGPAFTMKIRNPIVRRVADPRPVWGYPTA